MSQIRKLDPTGLYNRPDDELDPTEVYWKKKNTLLLKRYVKATQWNVLRSMDNRSRPWRNIQLSPTKEVIAIRIFQ